MFKSGTGPEIFILYGQEVLVLYEFNIIFSKYPVTNTVVRLQCSVVYHFLMANIQIIDQNHCGILSSSSSLAISIICTLLIRFSIQYLFGRQVSTICENGFLNPTRPPLWSKWQHARLSRSGPGFDPRSGQVSWVRFFRGFSSPVRQMS